MEQRISLEDLKRRRIALGSVATLGGLAIAGASIPFIQSMQPSVRTLSEYPNAPVTVDVSDLAVGKGTIVTWRGEPFVIFRRSNEDIRALQDIEHLLADPASKSSVQPEAAQNRHRSLDPEYLVASLLCTHLNCAVVDNPAFMAANSDPSYWKGGFGCPCHGANFDLAGRVYSKQPAPTNLAIPPYRFIGPKTIEIGWPL